jgi:hypothetical protein
LASQSPEFLILSRVIMKSTVFQHINLEAKDQGRLLADIDEQ